jgi:hypothetical protein
MNVGFDEHILEDALEAYSMGKLSEEESAPLEEHLLLCPTCQGRLDATDEYIQVTKAAASNLDDSVKAGIFPFISKLIMPLNIPRSAWAALFALLIVLLAIPLNRTPRLESELTLQSARGGPTFPRAQAAKSLLLRMDITEIQQPEGYQLEVVDANGQPIWHAFVTSRNSRIVTVIPKRLRPGRYWVRLYDTGRAGTLLREYGLDVE